MKKLIYIGAAALLAAGMLVSCSGKDADKDNKGISLSDYKDMTAGDSLAFYIGQFTALEYWQMASQDSTFMTEEARNEFLKGLRAGYESVGDKDAYNTGFYKGVQLAMQFKEFDKEFEISAKKSYIFDALKDGLRNDSAVNMSDAQLGFAQIQNSLEARKEAKDRDAAQKLLKEAGAKGKWTVITPELYAAPGGQPGNGAQVKDGSEIGIECVISRMDGTAIDQRNNASIIVGKSYPGPMTQAMLVMRVGETKTFYTTALSLYGRTCGRYRVEPTEILKFQLTVKPADKTVKEDDGSY